MRLKHKPWALPLFREHPHLVYLSKEREEPLALPATPLAMEIGVGRGDFLRGIAKLHPDIYWLGIERNADALVVALKKFIEEDAFNGRLVLGDFAELVTQLPTHRFTYIFLNFSDPWPKKRHAKRRLTSPTFLKWYEDLLAPSGMLILKTDNGDFYRYSKEMFVANGYRLVIDEEDYQFNEDDDAMSEYERKFRERGQSIYRLGVVKEEKHETK